MTDPAGFFTGYVAVSAEGARVGIHTCTLCGVAVLAHPEDSFDPLRRHIEWHSNSDTLHGYTNSGEQVTVQRRKP